MKHTLKLVVVAALAVTARDVTAQSTEGKPLYLKHCRSCHGTTGAPPNQAKREFPKIRTLDAAFLGKLSLDSVVAVITKGFGKGDDMKPFKSKMTNDEIAAVARYVKEVLGAPKPE